MPMKLILAIVNNDDSNIAASALTDAGFSVTKLSTTGGFLMVGNTTFLIGVEEDKTDKVIEILSEHCKTRKKPAPSTASFGNGLQNDSLPEEVTVGGASIFVLNVDKKVKLK